jgi:RecB family endonuclease NucS
LQRVVNGGGRIDREYALGKGALDLLITWKSQRIAIELKLRRDTETEDDALEQVTRYLDALDVPEGWLVLFDLRSTAPWPQRLFRRTETVGPRTVHIVGC